MLQVQALHLAESYINDADCHSNIRRLLALPFLHAEHIPPMMTRLREEASHTDTYDGLLDYMQNTWVDSTLWTPDRWSVFYRTVRTNNDVEGWHHRLNQNAQKDQLPLYVMIQLLFQATTVNLQMRLLSQHKIRRRQSKKYRDRDLQDHEILGAVCWRPEDPEFLVKVMCSPECPTRLFNLLYIL